MKILQINTVYGTGSTGKITAAIKELIEENGHEAFVAYGRGEKMASPNFYRVGNKVDFIMHVLINFFQGKSGFGSKRVTRRFLKWVDEIQPDIIHLHNIHGFYIHVGMLFDYIKSHNIKVVWTLHDCWPFTGQCAFFDMAGCDKWKEGCFECPVYRSDYPYSLFKDNSVWNYEEKKKCFTEVVDMTIVTPSRWLAELVKKSFLQKNNVQVINNGINLEIFHPFEANIISEANKKIVLAVANVWDKRKGLEYVTRLIGDLPEEEYQIVIIGLDKKQKKSIDNQFSSKGVVTICRTNNQKELAMWYSDAYVYVNPTLQDNFPTTNLEALACGTPVITFETGGSPESVDDNTGKVVEKGDYRALLKAVICADKNQQISDICRKKALNYDAKMCFDKYLDIY